MNSAGLAFDHHEQRHQMIYAAIPEEMKAIHALSINARAPGE